MDTWRKNIEALVERFANELVSENELKVGTQIWLPCSGAKSTQQNYSARKGHTGNILTVTGHENGKNIWERSEVWVEQETAQADYPEILISTSSSHCPTCVDITNNE